ncbi:FkbM family methyltransferase [Chloroflexota bacterium]
MKGVEMKRVLRSIISSLHGQTRKLLKGTFAENLPGARTLNDFLFWHLRAKEDYINIQGSKIYVNPEGLPRRFACLFKEHIITGIWEELTTALFMRAIKEGDIVVDIGANIGYFTLLASRLVGDNGKVFAFEPEPVNFSLLVKNIEENGYKNVISVQKCVAKTTGTVRLFVDEGCALTHSICKHGDSEHSIEIEAVSLDDFFLEKEHPINIVKIDIEGAEMEALLGMDKWIRQNKDLKIFTEFYPALMKEAGYTVEEFARKVFQEWHFSVTAIDDYSNDKRYIRVSSIDELMALFKVPVQFLNLLLER